METASTSSEMTAGRIGKEDQPHGGHGGDESRRQQKGREDLPPRHPGRGAAKGLLEQLLIFQARVK